MLTAAGAVAVEALDPSDVDAGVAAHYGDPMREQRLLATEVGLVDRSNRGVIAVPGRRPAELAAQPHHPAPRPTWPR